MKVRVEYEPTPVRHIAVQCPGCSNWFNGRDITEDELGFSYEIPFAQFICPVCGKVFGGNAYEHCANMKIEEVAYPDIYKDCLQRKEVWE